MSRHELYQAIQDATGTYYDLEERPLHFEVDTIGELGEIWEVNAECFDLYLRRCISTVWVELDHSSRRRQ